MAQRSALAGVPEAVGLQARAGTGLAEPPEEGPSQPSVSSSPEGLAAAEPEAGKRQKSLFDF
ncbi:Uncharacterised protein [uncultured archaeon]|nr:Uncharacterised protein [uncultured archaeon]